jgi:ATP-dependent helicase HrpB
LLADAVLADPVLRARVTGPHAALLDRLAFLARAMPDLGLAADPDTLVADAVRACAAGRRRVAALCQADLGAALLGGLTHTQRGSLAREAPAEIRLPTGRSVPVVYRPDAPPAIAARIQELFGLTTTPRLAAGRVPLVVQLLAPNQRPVQVTDDLAGFWRTTYFDVRKQLRGRYPKHAWPDDPLAAPPIARPGRRT